MLRRARKTLIRVLSVITIWLLISTCRVPSIAFADASEADIATLTSSLRDAPESAKRQRSAYELGRLGPSASQAVEVLIQALSDEHWGVRGEVASALAKIKSTEAIDAIRERVIPMLITGIRSEDVDVRRLCAETLGKLSVYATKAVAPLRRALVDENMEVRKYAAFALGAIGDKSAVNSLIQALSDIEWDVRQVAARSLGNLSAYEAVDALGEALGDKYQPVRWDATIALSKLGKPAQDYLRKALEDDDRAVSMIARQALEEMGAKE